MFRKYLTAMAFIGIVIGKGATAFIEGLRSGNKGQMSRTTIMFNVLAQQNALLLGHVLGVQNRLMGEVLGNPDDGGPEGGPINEISCRGDHLEMVRKLMDNESEGVVKEAAIWATKAVGDFGLTMRSISLETERSTEPDRDRDVVLVFHVAGKGEDALRFQAEASRRMREASDGPDAAASVKILRVDVRWS